MKQRAEVPRTDLSGLEDFSLSSLGEIRTPAAIGKPVRIPVDDVEEDPENARKEYDEDYIRELATSIEASDVKEPISVRSKGANGKYRLNSGSCRLRATKLTTRKDIPAFIDDEWDEDDRFVVNVQRLGLTPMDQARYLEKRLPKFGGNRSELAKRVGKSPAYITQHLALLQLPPSVQQLYDKGVTRNVTALYELARLHTKNAAAVEQAIEGATEIGGAMLQQLSAAIKGTDASDTSGEAGGGERDAAGTGEQKRTKAVARDELRVRILVTHKGKRYELAGDFTTTLKPTAGRVYVRKGSDKPIQISLKDVALDTIIIK